MADNKIKRPQPLYIKVYITKQFIQNHFEFQETFTINTFFRKLTPLENTASIIIFSIRREF